MNDDLFSQLREVLPNDFSDDLIRELAEWSDPCDYMDALDDFSTLEMLVEDPDLLSDEELYELIMLSAAQEGLLDEQ